MKVILDNIELDISKKLFGRLNVAFNGQTISINDSLERVVEIIKGNYETIKSHYTSNLLENQADEDHEDRNAICVNILIYYLDQYSRWKEQYKKSNYDIKFYEKDFDHPSTYDIVISYLKDKYPDNWKSISAKYLNMTSEQFDFYWTSKLAYYNK